MNRLALLSAIAVMATAVSTQAATLLSFEGDALGTRPSYVTDKAPAVTYAVSTIGATDGTQSLAITTGGAFQWIEIAVSADAWNALGSEHTLNFNYTITADQATNFGTWFSMVLGVNSNNGWGQMPDPSYTLDLSVGTHTATIDYTPILSKITPPSGNWFQLQLGFGHQASTSATVYVDNFAVPEPASLGLLGLGSLALCRRRHSN